MSAVRVPLALDTPLYTMRIALDGRDYVLRFDWNGRQTFWYVGIYLAEDASLVVTGIKLVVNRPLLQRESSSNRPPGDFIAFDPSSNVEPGFTDLGRRVQLLYVSAETAAATLRASQGAGEGSGGG